VLPNASSDDLSSNAESGVLTQDEFLEVHENSSSREEFWGQVSLRRRTSTNTMRSKILSCRTLIVEQIGRDDGRIARLASITVGLTRQHHLEPRLAGPRAP